VADHAAALELGDLLLGIAEIAAEHFGVVLARKAALPDRAARGNRISALAAPVGQRPATSAFFGRSRPAAEREIDWAKSY
jgi:hypothetical protein